MLLLLWVNLYPLGTKVLIVLCSVGKVTAFWSRFAQALYSP